MSKKKPRDPNLTNNRDRYLVRKTDQIHLTTYVSNILGKNVTKLVLIHDAEWEERRDMILNIARKQDSNTAILIVPTVGDYDPNQTKETE